jgi:hypothetical protein
MSAAARTSATDSTSTCPPIAHPTWCQRIADDDASFDERGRGIGPAEPPHDREHRGEPYRLEAGGALDTVLVQAVQLYELDGDEQLSMGSQVRLAITMREMVGSADAHLTVDDVDRLIVLLNAVKRDLDLCGRDRG